MGYRIRYGHRNMKHAFKVPYISFDRRKIIWVLCAAAIGVTAFSLRFKSVRSFLLPGNPEVTESALTNFVDDLKSGESIDAAVVAFCQEIIDNAEVS